MKDEFKDTHLKINASLYEYVCIPIRIIISIMFMFSVLNDKHYIPASIILGLITLGLIRKQQISYSSWKPYVKSIVIYIVCIILMIFKPTIPPYAIGVLLLNDAVMGLTTKFIYNRM